MMLPRLKLARNLLTEDGVVFISIDDGEQAALKKICDEVFGEHNFLAQLVWESAFSPINLKKNFSNSHDYILAYAKNEDNVETYGLPRDEASLERYQNPDNDPRGPWQSDNFSVGPAIQKNIYEVTTPSGNSIFPPNGRSWLLSQDRFEQFKQENRIWFGVSGGNVPRIKRFLSEVKSTVTPMSIWKHAEVGHSQSASQALKKLFDDKAYFSYPKPVGLVRRATLLYTSQKDIVLDFFAGSSTTAHAVMQLNAEDGGNRKFIMVQLPELSEEKSDAYKDGYKTIADISKERIRRAGQDIINGECHTDWKKDIGFRVLKVDTSNMQDVYYQPQQLKQAEMFNFVDNIKADRTSEDLLFQVLLDWGVDLTLPIRRETLQGKEVFIVDDNALVACFEQGISEELIHELAALNPLRAVFRDNGFATDAVKVNVTQIFKQRSPITEVKSI